MDILISSRQQRDESREFVSWFRSFLTISVACIAVVLFFLTRSLIHRLASNVDFILPTFALATAIALLFLRVSYDGLGSIYKILARSTAAGLIAYLVLETPSFTLADQAYAHVAAYVDIAYWIALILTTLGLWRPSFLFPAGFYVISTRYAADEISGFTTSVLDIRYMIEMAQFLAICACAVALLRWAAGRWREHAWTAPLRLLDLDTLSLCLAFSAIGFHLGNYFWSGIEKLLIGPNLLTWTVENQTQNIMVGALKRGVLPTGHLPNLTQMLFEGLGNVVVISNTFVVATQLFAILAVLRLNWLKFASLAYDGLHIGIYVFGGLFFWPWIWNNVSILLAVRNNEDRRVGWHPKLCCIIVILLGGSLGASARLAWWDVTDIKIPMVQAQTDGGAWIDVPVSFFMSHSYAVSHGYLDLAATQGHYLPTIWGSTKEYERRLSSGTCPEPPVIDHAEAPEEKAERIARVKSFIRAHHSKMVELAEDGSQTNFYLRSHHHPSNPWLYETFNEADLSKIERYRVVTQSVCLSMSEGRLKERVIKQDVITIELGG